MKQGHIAFCLSILLVSGGLFAAERPSTIYAPSVETDYSCHFSSTEKHGLVECTAQAVVCPTQLCIGTCPPGTCTDSFKVSCDGDLIYDDGLLTAQTSSYIDLIGIPTPTDGNPPNVVILLPSPVPPTLPQTFDATLNHGNASADGECVVTSPSPSPSPSSSLTRR